MPPKAVRWVFGGGLAGVNANDFFEEKFMSRVYCAAKKIPQKKPKTRKGSITRLDVITA